MDVKDNKRPGVISEDEAIGAFAASDIAMILTNPRLPDNPIVYTNTAFEKLTGYTRDTAIGRNCRFLQGEGTDAAQVTKMREAIEAGENISLVLKNYRADGTEFLNALVISTVLEAEGAPPAFFVGLQSEVDQDQDLSEAFEHQIGELQHRVKNHLSMIVGLIRTQSRRSTDPESLTEISRRVESLQLLYEEMTNANGGKNSDEINLAAYLGRVAAAISHIDGRPGVRMNVDVATVLADSDTAARIGLIVSEILTNAMQHAFDGQQSGLVELRVTQTDEGGVRATITDDGIGIPKDIDWPDGGGFGARIVRGLCEGLDATITVSRGAIGTIVVLDVPFASKM